MNKCKLYMKGKIQGQIDEFVYFDRLLTKDRKRTDKFPAMEMLIETG